MLLHIWRILKFYLKACAALTALCQPSYKSSLCSSFISTSKRLSSFQCFLISFLSFQTPTASPAKNAAPRTVVSLFSGRSTGTPRISD